MKMATGRISRVEVLETFAAFAIVSLLAAVFLRRQELALLALALLAVALVVKPVAQVVTCWWFRFSALLSAISNRVILTLVFFLILTPIALLYRLFNKDPLHLKAGTADSFYTERNHTYSKVDMEKLW